MTRALPFAVSMDSSTGARFKSHGESILARLAVVYLALPAVVFLVGFVDGAVAIPILVLLVSALFLEVRARPESGRRLERVDWRAAGIGAGSGLVVLYVVGFPKGPFA